MLKYKTEEVAASARQSHPEGPRPDVRQSSESPRALATFWALGTLRSDSP